MSVLVGRAVPDFVAPAVLENGDSVDKFSLSKYIEGKYALVFFYPFDFTFVCPTELIALNNRIDAFLERKIAIVGVSIDSLHTHRAWRKTDIASGGIGEIRFPLVSDVKHTICQSYGIQHPEEGASFRGAFIVDKHGVVRAQIVNDLPIGRDIDEILRLFDAVRFHEEHGEVCPVGWQQGKAGMQETPDSVAAYLEEHSSGL